MNKSRLIELTSKIISFQSVTPDNTKCLDFISDTLNQIGFQSTIQTYTDTKNLYSTQGNGKNLCFLGHTDVVPVIDEKLWENDPFTLTLKNNLAIARGISDMKGAIACFIHALECVQKEHSELMHKKQISILLTGDEEGDGKNGVKKFIDEFLIPNQIKIDYCLIGEPTGEKCFNDCIKIGRRGSANFEIKLTGQEGHIAYQNNFVNPITHAVNLCQAIKSYTFDTGNEYFEPTNLEVRNFDAKNPTTNIVPKEAIISFNIRYNTIHSFENIVNKVQEIVKNNCQIKYDFITIQGADGYFCKDENFSNFIKNSIQKTTGSIIPSSTKGGVTDGRYVKKICQNICEVGLSESTMHQINESIKEDELYKLCDIYKQIIIDFLSNDSL